MRERVPVGAVKSMRKGGEREKEREREREM
jgi:hypothetical protein